MSAPARNNFSIISFEEEAGPRVASCLVDLRHLWASLGTAATVACFSMGTNFGSLNSSADELGFHTVVVVDVVVDVEVVVVSSARIFVECLISGLARRPEEGIMDKGVNASVVGAMKARIAAEVKIRCILR